MRSNKKLFGSSTGLKLTIGGYMAWNRVSVRYEKERDMVYMRFRWFLRQEMSLEIEEMEEDLVIDVRESAAREGE